MRCNTFLFGIFLIFDLSSSVNYVPFMDESGIQSCMPDKKFNRADLSNFMILTKDSQLFANGTIKILHHIQAPLQVRFTTKRRILGKWVDGEFKRFMPNFCITMRSPVESFYQATKELDKCPFEKGQEFHFDMIPVTQKDIDTTSSLLGEWKLKVAIHYTILGDMGDCFISNWEVFEE
uniref:CSON003009 protein n=1 Tax=Culicoides sonorensis TaxID=179676 RepID=A0A336LSE1_CULSO